MQASNHSPKTQHIEPISGGGTNQEVVTAFSGGTLEVFAREGAAAPGGGNFDTSGTIFDADEAVFSENNQLVFQADLVGGGEGLFFDADTTVAGGLQNCLREGDSITLAGIGTANGHNNLVRV